MRQDLLVLDRKNTRLEAASGRLTVRIDELRPVSIALAPLERIIVATPVAMGSQLLNHLATHEVAVVFLPGHYKHSACWVLPFTHGDHQRRLRQYQLCNDLDEQMRIARLLVRHKLLGQKRNLTRWQWQFPAARQSLHLGIQRINNCLQQIPSSPNHDSLMGLEGTAAQAYFQGIAAMLAPSYGFNGRNRRPPKDPVNALLSLSYTLAQQEAESALVAYGLDAGLGFLHAPAYGRASLGCDLVELVRPALDAWVIGLFTRRRLTVEHFQYQGEACRLGKAGREHYFMAWASQRHRIKKRFHRFVRAGLKEISHV